jgi:catechol 2,3-dioxygenase-like lactoylglutathione lyase family enzyme
MNDLSFQIPTNRINARGLIRHPIRQYAWFVDDIDEACYKWNKMLGAGPFFVVRHHIGEGFLYRGKHIEADVSYAFGQAGPAHIQFIAQHDDTPSIYRDMYKKGENGFHHVGVLVPNVQEEVRRFQAAGYEVACELWGGDYVAYMDCRKDLGCFVELHGDAPVICQLFDGWQKQHEEWDGVTDLIRENTNNREGRQ